MTSDTEIWADLGTAALWSSTEVEPGDVLRFEEVAAMIRAAYGQGYVDALEDARPLTIYAAGSRLAELWCRLPVS